MAILVVAVPGPVGAQSQPAPSAAECAPASGLIYVSGNSAPVSDFLDQKGEPVGVHIDVIRALEREIGIPITVRLMRRADATAALLRGDAHLSTVGHSPSRESQFDYLGETVRSRVSVLFNSRARKVSGPTDFAGLRVAVTSGSYAHDQLVKMAPALRPELILLQSTSAGWEMWKDGQVDGMAGVAGVLVATARSLGERDFVEVPFETIVIHLATREGCGNSLAAVTSAMQKLRDQGVIDLARERWSTTPDDNLKRWLGIAGLGFVSILAAVLAWTWTLRRQVRERTAALALAKETAELATGAKSAFLAAMSHEIRTPLNAVIATASVLEQLSVTADQRELVDVIRKGGDSLLSVVSDILDFSKIEAGRLELEIVPFDLPALLRDAVVLIARTASAKGLQVDAEVGEGCPQWVAGDSHRLRQVVLNLLSNAVKFTDRGRIVVRATAAAADPDGRAVLHVSVIDSGMGIPADRLPRLFQSFSQADSSTTRRFGGTGLGLVISKHLIELMGGHMSVESTPGQGSTFAFTLALPVVEAVDTSAARAIPARLDAWSRMRVLLAEDNPINQLIERRILSSLGVECDVVANGQEAVDAAARTSYDVIFLDLQMPVMSGSEAARLLRAAPNTPWLVAFSADVTSDVRRSCVEAGFDDYLSKPVTVSDIAASLGRVPMAREFADAIA